MRVSFFASFSHRDRPAFVRARAVRGLSLGVGALALAAALFQCRGKDPSSNRLRFSGSALGTTYSIQIAPPFPKNREKAGVLHQAIRRELDRLDGILSTWKKDSEISRFNRYRSTAPRKTSPDFARVLALSLRAARATGGAFDPTLHELIELWGFGKKKGGNPPSAAIISRVLARSGYKKIRLEGNRLRKLHPKIQLNLSGSAKGYIVDRLADLIQKRGYPSYLVEIGGEIRVGTTPPSRPWKIGIELPNYKTSDRRAHALLELKQTALATSGDYRNFVISGGEHRSHILDPRTGESARTPVVSATVIGPECALADALATALLVLGEKEGLRTIIALPGYEALLLIKSDDGKLREAKTPGFPRYKKAELK